MIMMPAATLRDLDLTDIDTLFPYFWWKTKSLKKPQSAEPEGEIVYRGGKPYRKIDAKNAKWL